MNYRKIPFIGTLIRKMDYKFSQLEKMQNFISYENIKFRVRQKISNKIPINVVFVCHRPAVWESLRSVYNSLKRDDSFDVRIVAIPDRRLKNKADLKNEFYQSDGAESFWTTDDVVNGYDYKEKKWLDLRNLEPDYVFFQQPYDSKRPEFYKSKYVSKYAILPYVHYAADFIGKQVFEESMPAEFANNIGIFFCQNDTDKCLISDYFKKIDNNFSQVILSGFPRYDNFNDYKGADSKLWNLPKEHNNFRIIWTPRWCTDEGTCNFFEYKTLLLSYVKAHKNVDFIFRPHPQAFMNWELTGEFPKEKADAYKLEYENTPNACIDYSKDYFQTFFSSDCLVTDISSIIADYFLTGKPIIYCHKSDYFNNFSRKLSEGFYWVRNWNELESTINMLRDGKDPLKEKRLELIKSQYFLPENGAGNFIKNYLKNI